MNFPRHPQCTFCAEMNRYMDFNQREQPFYQVNSYSHYPERPFLYCYDMTQRPNQDNYITYCNIVNNFSSDKEPQYVQVIDAGVSKGRVQLCVKSNNNPVIQSSQRSFSNKLVPDRSENNCSVVLCTCNDFLNYNMQNKMATEPRSSREGEQPQDFLCNNNSSSKLMLAPQLSRARDSIDSHEKSAEDQQDNSVYSSGSLLSDPMCRFCHLSKNTQADQLISPCHCCGTLKYVHQNCLKTWLEVSKKQRENSGNKSPHCELCNFKYVRKRKFQFGKIRQPKLSQNDCALHLIFLCSLLVMVTSASVTILCFAMEKSASGGNKAQSYDKPSDGNLRFTDRKPTDMSKGGNILCEYLSTLSMKDYTSSERQSASKLSVICDMMLKKDRKPNKVPSSAADTLLSESTAKAISVVTTTLTPIIWKKDSYHQRGLSKHAGVSGNGAGVSRLWILTPEEAVTLASGVIFFIAFFIAMVVQVKSSYTCYQLVMEWVRLNYTHEVQSVHQQKKTADIEMKRVSGAVVKPERALPREYIERCVTEI